MSVVVTGATGHLGRLAVQHLLARGVPADQIIAAGRDAGRLADTAAGGVRTAVIDFSDPASLDAAFADADKVMLVSSSEVGKRVDQHRNAIEAAARAGVTQLVYTSAPRATTSALILAPEHKATEELIVASGVPFTILRNNWYHENYDSTLGQVAQSGEYVASTGDGRVASASRSDYAEAIAAVLTGDGHVGRTYELGGDAAGTGDDFAAAAAEALGRPVSYRAVSSEQHAEILSGFGLDEATVGFVVGLDANIRDGLLSDTTGDLASLIGHPTQPLADYLREAAARS